MGSAESEFAATSRTEKSLCTKAQTRQPKASDSNTNCPAAAGYTACIQRCWPRHGPTRPKKACAAASSNARIIAYCPISGIIDGGATLVLRLRRVFHPRLAPAQRFLHRRRHVVLVVLGQHFIGHEYARFVQAAVGDDAGVFLEEVGQHAVVDHRDLGNIVRDDESHLERAGRPLYAAGFHHAPQLETLAGFARAGHHFHGWRVADGVLLRVQRQTHRDTYAGNDAQHHEHASFLYRGHDWVSFMARRRRASSRAARSWRRANHTFSHSTPMAIT